MRLNNADGLTNFFGSVIAKRCNIPEESITSEWIRQQRETKIYPNMIPEDEKYLKAYSRNIWDRLSAIVDKAMENI